MVIYVLSDKTLTKSKKKKNEIRKSGISISIVNVMGKTQFGFIDSLLVMLFVCDTHMLVSDLQNTPFPLTSTIPP